MLCGCDGYLHVLVVCRWIGHLCERCCHMWNSFSFSRQIWGFELLKSNGHILWCTFVNAESSLDSEQNLQPLFCVVWSFALEWMFQMQITLHMYIYICSNAALKDFVNDFRWIYGRMDFTVSQGQTHRGCGSRWIFPQEFVQLLGQGSPNHAGTWMGRVASALISALVFTFVLVW